MYKDIRFIKTDKGMRVFYLIDTDYSEPQEVSIPDHDARLGLHARAVMAFYKKPEKVVESLAIFFSEFYDRDQVIKWTAAAIGDEINGMIPLIKEKVNLIPRKNHFEKVLVQKDEPKEKATGKRGRK